MSAVTGSNRHRFQRMDTDFPVLVECAGRRFEARVQMLGQDGLQIEGSAVARVGELFSVTFGAPSAAETFRARIAWARPSGAAFRFGCLFWAVEEEARRLLLLRLIRYSTLHRPAGNENAPGETRGANEDTAAGNAGAGP